MLKKHIASTLAIALMATAGATAHAAAYPEKPVTMIVGFSPGGFTDVVARLVSRHLEQKLGRSEEHTSELQSLMRISYAVFCLKKKKKRKLQVMNIIERTHKISRPETISVENAQRLN